MKKLSFITLFLLLIQTTSIGAETFAKNGMVVSDNAIASNIGVEILKQGGNAIDASVATALALSVTFPQAGNIGGGGFLVYMKNPTEVTTIDFREKAPLLASPTMFLNKDGNIRRGSNRREAIAIGVPGTIAGLFMAHQKYGVLPWKTLVQPAIDLAEKGFPLSWTLSQHAQAFGRDANSTFMKNYFNNPDGKVTAFGDLWKQPALAKTLTHIRDHGHDGFYAGDVAKKIVAFMQKNHGIISQKDLTRYQAIERKPIKGTYKGYSIYAMPPPSSGGVALVEMMNMMERVDFDKVKPFSASYYHLLAETMRRAFADRAEHLGDPDFNLNMPLEKLTSKKFAQKRYENINHNRASISDTSKFGQLYDGANTTHISVIDRSGKSVALTYTIEQRYGSQLGSEELGFIFNNEMGDFNPKPDHTDEGWLIGTNPNIIQPEKRMLSSMTPTIIAKDDKPILVIGSPGGRTIINTVFQTVLNVLEFNMSVEKAIEAPKIHHQCFPINFLRARSPVSRHKNIAPK